MRAVVQRVSRAKVMVNGRITGEIGGGLMVLLGVSAADEERDADYLVEKIVNLRIFENVDGKMDRSIADVEGEMLVVSQFTLYADTRRGRRPSYIRAARGETAVRLYEYFVRIARCSGLKVETGEFGAMMDVELTNYGPVTIILDSEKTI
ncbi:MAG: D-aminoacyl-tRNA deacylase [Pyrinomonadaceae bacterium]